MRERFHVLGQFRDLFKEAHMDRCYFLVPLGLAGGLLLLLADRPMAASGPLAAYQPVSQPAAAGTTQATVDSANNLKQILLALYNYHDTHGALPLPALTDKAGKPLLSWRVALLPYLEHEGLYREFKLNEPWDSEHNKKLIGRMPKVYATPGTKEEAELGLIGLTRYRVFVGNGAAWEMDKAMRIADFTDGTSNTWLVVVAKEAVPWTKPDELPYDPKKDPSELLGKIDNRWQIGFSDGSIRTLQKLPDAKIIHGFITRNGGEVLPFDDHQE
jgi:hypothetical protein